MIDIQSIKQRYGIIGTSPALNRAIEIAVQVATTDLSVLITGESGVGKENFPKIIHEHSARKHNTYIAVNCGAIPEGTIDSELFGHEKGSFTGALEARKGYFEQSDGGTIFLDEVAELPLATQARLLRVLESGEYMRVGSSKTQKTNVRVVAATNVNLVEAVSTGRFREDLYYRLNTVPIQVPALRDRKSDILLLFKKFALDFSAKYNMPSISLTPEAEIAIQKYRFPGNVRQLKNMVEQISIIESDRLISVEVLELYIPKEEQTNALQLFNNGKHQEMADKSFERELIFKFLAEMQKDINDLKLQVSHIGQTGVPLSVAPMSETKSIVFGNAKSEVKDIPYENVELADYEEGSAEEVKTEELSLQKKEKEMIRRALEKNNGKRKDAAKDLGISERTLYRKLIEFGLNK